MQETTNPSLLIHFFFNSSPLLTVNFFPLEFLHLQATNWYQSCQLEKEPKRCRSGVLFFLKSKGDGLMLALEVLTSAPRVGASSLV